jgi:Ca-activated chloride channel family protein
MRRTTMRHAWRIGWGAAALTALLGQAACGADDSGDTAGTADHGPAAPAPQNGARFEDHGVDPEVDTTEDGQSTFALDVDTGSYTVARGYLDDGFLPDPASVRTEEFVNYFAQDYQPPADGIGIHVDGTSVPFLDDPSKRVLRVGLQAAVVDDTNRQPANLTFVVDTSGSMEGYNMEMVHAGLNRLVDSLRPTDRVAIASFSTDAELRLPMTPMTEPEPIRAAIAELAPQDSTNLEAGLRVGYEHAQANLRSDGINRVVLLSDGAANEGEVDPGALANRIAQEAGDDTQLVVVGVGRQTYDETVLEQFADQGNGFYAYIDTIKEAERLFVHDLTGTLEVMALDAKVQVTFNPEAVSHYRLLGYENRQLADEDFQDDTTDGGEVGAGHSVTALYEVTVPEGGEVAAGAELATVDVRWTDPDGGGPVERSATITAGDLAGSFDQAPDRLRQDVLVAAFAECLRDAPWSERVSLGQVADNAQVLSSVLADDQDVAELAQLTRTAADLIA